MIARGEPGDEANLGPLAFELEETWNTGFSVMSPQQVPITI